MHAGWRGCNAKTFRKWTWIILEEMSEVSAIKVRKERFCFKINPHKLTISVFYSICSSYTDKLGKSKKGDTGNHCLVSVDCTDCKISEPYPFQKGWSEKWFSPKFKGPGVRYEVGLSIFNGDIVWVNGPFPCGLFPDLKIFMECGMKDNLDNGERVEADDGYAGADPEFTKTRSGIFHKRSLCVKQRE